MSTFRSRQRANLRHDTKRAPRVERPEEGKTPTGVTTPTARQQGTGAPAAQPRKPFDKRGATDKPFEKRSATDKPFEKRGATDKPFEKRGATDKPFEKRSAADKPRPAPAAQPAPVQARAPMPAPDDTDQPRKLFAKRSDTQRPVENAAPQAPHEPYERPRKSFIKGNKGDSPRRQEETATPPGQQDPAERPRHSFIKRDTGDRPQRPADTAPEQEQKTFEERPRKSFIKRNEDDSQQRPERESAPRLRQPSPHAPEQRRGLPATEQLPTERPAFERRSAETRRRGDAPVGLALFTACPRGLEPVLQQELHRLGAQEISVVDGGVGCEGSLELMMRINLHSRVASRVLLRLAHGAYRGERDVNALAMQIDWPHHFDVSRTIKVKTDGVGAQVKSLEYVSLTVKDAICDRFRQAQQGRPNVDTRLPDVRIQVFLSPDTASIYLDSSGEPLFKRGWRKETGEAPLRENLAAGILQLAGYNGEQALIDPMCGSGTFLVEAAEIALNRAPGRHREFAFQKWKTFDAATWATLKDEAAHAEKSPTVLAIKGSDNDPKLVAIARANLERAGLRGWVSVEEQDMFDVRPTSETGLIVTNPPYGVRLEEQETLADLYPRIGDWLKQNFAGWTVNLFTGDMRLAKLIRLTIKRRIPLYNGALQCRLFVLPMVAGSARDDKE